MLAIQKAAEKGFKSRGSAGMLQAQLNEQKKFHSQGKYEPYFVAQTCSRLGYTQEALKYLDLSFQRRDEDYIMLAVDPAFDNLHSNPSFPIFLARGGLPPLP